MTRRRKEEKRKGDDALRDHGSYHEREGESREASEFPRRQSGADGEKGEKEETTGERPKRTDRGTETSK